MLRKKLPKNYIAPLADNSIEMETARLLADIDGVHIYSFTTTDTYDSLTLYFSEYQSGKLINKENIEIGFDDIGSPKNGEIVFVPDFKNFVIKLIVSAEGSKISTEIPILEDVMDWEYYGRSASRIEGDTKILYDIEQPLIGFIYDNDVMSVIDIYDMLSGEHDAFSENDYVYLFSYEFHK